MRGTMCHRDTMRIVGRTKYFKKVTKFGMFRRLAIPFVKKCLDIKSPSLLALGLATYEYDYLKAKYKEALNGTRK